jgi:hypothetical protein
MSATAHSLQLDAYGLVYLKAFVVAVDVSNTVVLETLEAVAAICWHG